METCVGCGSPLAPSWKFCVHCGVAVESRVIPGAFRPTPASAPNTALRNRLLIIGGVGIFLIGVALLVVAVAIFTGGFR
jgi:hypothetical protein